MLTLIPNQIKKLKLKSKNHNSKLFRKTCIIVLLGVEVGFIRPEFCGPCVVAKITTQGGLDKSNPYPKSLHTLCFADFLLTYNNMTLLLFSKLETRNP